MGAPIKRIRITVFQGLHWGSPILSYCQKKVPNICFNGLIFGGGLRLGEELFRAKKRSKNRPKSVAADLLKALAPSETLNTVTAKPSGSWNF